jgi:GDPmannose 4,6-dehydratase
LFYDLADEGYDHVYHFAAVSHVKTSSEDPALTFLTNTVATSHLFNAFYKRCSSARIYNAATSEMFGEMSYPEMLHFYPRGDTSAGFWARSPYGASKIASHQMAKMYRRRGLFVVSGIGFNHESQRRGEHFVTRKIGLSLRESGKVTLGNVQAQRDWHHAKDYVWGVHLALCNPVSQDYIFASGKPRSVLEFAVEACKVFDLDPAEAIKVEDYYTREWDVDYLAGDPSKAEELLGWKRNYSFKDIVEDCCANVEKHSSLRL